MRSNREQGLGMMEEAVDYSAATELLLCLGAGRVSFTLEGSTLLVKARGGHTEVSFYCSGMTIAYRPAFRL